MINSASGYSTTLTPPVNAQDHAQGPENAPVTLVEYGDFECPSCGQAYPIVKELQQHMGDRMRFVYRYYPLHQHPHAEHAAEMAEAAGTMGKFWPMFDMLYQHQNALDDNHLLHYAQQLELNTQKIDEDMRRHVYENRVSQDIDSGDASGVLGTPTFYINGEQYNGSYDLESLQSALEQASTR